MKDNLSFEIKTISSDQTLPIRHKAMWPNKPLDFVKIKNDEKGNHFGLFLNDKLISVVSLFIEQKEAQFRKFATLPEFQGKGYGSHLLKMLFEIIQQKDCNKIWCNARVSKIDYYKGFGLSETDNTFEKAENKYVVMEKII